MDNKELEIRLKKVAEVVENYLSEDNINTIKEGSSKINESIINLLSTLNDGKESKSKNEDLLKILDESSDEYLKDELKKYDNVKTIVTDGDKETIIPAPDTKREMEWAYERGIHEGKLREKYRDKYPSRFIESTLDDYIKIR